ncbi:hypothetical protein CTAYLR_006617 [Chrysophaeum taylorii]|uniref:Sister chromatid cohesion protein n=1 Tax=Chrysophaeum taylorii TaxID=2483200 RepID=A0AAD7ULA2_9STRA|nr:hypothetical protein CTAYLR_006617 [Chrysophaeum taylorii]
MINRLLVQHSLGDRRGDDPPKFETAMRVAKFYCTAVIDRCKNAPEWRASAKLLVDDVTAVLVVPDWPAAETLSHALATVLVAELNAPLSKKKGALDFVGFVIDMLAPLAASIKRIEVAAHPIDLPRSEAPAADDEGCSTAKKSKATRSTRGKKRRAEEPAFNLSADIEQRVALQQLLLNAIGERTASEPWMANARAYQVARWYAALPADSADHVHRHVVRQWFAADGHSRSLRRGTWDVVLPARDLAPVARRVFVESSGLARALGLLVTSLANQLARENASLRSRAVKALDEVVRVDASLMANDIVRATVASRFRDEAISVRQAAVELVGAHALASSWETYESYHDALLARLADCGVSVRKSVVRILRSALEANATHAVHKHTLALLIERASVLDEEQTIKDLILTVVRDVWFSAAAAADADKKGSPRAAAKRPKNTTTTTCHPRGLPELDVTTRQIIDVVATSRSSEWVSGVVNSALQDASNVVKSEEASTAKATREYKRRHASVERAATHVDALVEHLLRLDEFRRRSRGEETLGDLDAAAAADVVATVSTLRTFAKARPSIVAPQLLVLAPYLRGDNGLKESHEGAVCCVVAETIMVCLESLPRSEAANVISVVVPDLLGIMHRFGTAPVAAAVRCLVTMSRARCGGPEVTARTQLARLASWYYDVLKRVDTNGGAVSPVAARATVVLGVACRWFPDGLAAAIGSKFVEAAYRALAKLFQTSRESPVRVVAAICDLVAGSPRFAVAAHDDGVLAAMLEHPNDSVRAKALSAWADVVNTSAIYDLTDDPRTFTDAKSADAAYVVAGATQARIPGLVAAMHVGSAEARAASLNLLGAILSHGLVNPLDVVPSVLAAMGDSSKPVARGAARLLFLEHEKRPQYVLARFVEGIVLCFRVRARRSEAVASGEEDDEAEVLRALAGAYARCVQPSKAGRYATLRRLVGLFSEERDVAVLAGVASLVATLPYASCDEPLFVVYHATRQAALVQDIAVGGLLGRIKADLQKTHRLSDTRVETYIPK